MTYNKTDGSPLRQLAPGPVSHRKMSHLPANYSSPEPRTRLRWFAAVLAGCAFLAGCGQPTDANGGPDSTTENPVDSTAEEVTDSPLAHDMRQHVWNIEHFGFVLEATVFPKLKNAINDGRLDEWSSILANDATAAIPKPDAVSVKQIAGNTAEFGAVTLTEADLKTGSRDAFLNWLRERRALLEECSSGMGLVRLIPDADDLKGSWTSVWRLRLAGKDATGPVELEFEIAVDLAELNDEIADHTGWVTSVEVLRESTFRAQQAYFRETTLESGLVRKQRHDNWSADEFVPNTGGMYVTDYDLDGHLDVFVDDHRDGNRLYRGIGNGTFEDVTKNSGIDPGTDSQVWTLSCWADLDNDGDDDLINQDRLYENLGNGRFEDITDKIRLPLTPAAGYAVADFDNDGLLDLYVCHSSAYRVGQSEKARVKWIDDGLGIDNVLLKNIGSWQFEDVTKKMNAGGNGSSCFTAVWLHANDDDRPDLFAINEFGVNSLLLSSPDGPFQASDVDPVFGGFSMGVAAGDYNNDGHTDLYVANMYSKAGNRILANVDRQRYPEDLYRKIEEGTRGSKLYQAKGDGSYQTVPETDMYAWVGWAYGPTFADFDNDGWLDIYATAGFKSEERGKPDG